MVIVMTVVIIASILLLIINNKYDDYGKHYFKKIKMMAGLALILLLSSVALYLGRHNLVWLFLSILHLGILIICLIEYIKHKNRQK